MEDPSSTKRKSKRSKKPSTTSAGEDVSTVDPSLTAPLIGDSSGSTSSSSSSASAKDHVASTGGGANQVINQLRARTQTFVEQTLQRARTDNVFRQKLQVGLLIFVVALVVLAQIIQMNQLGISRFKHPLTNAASGKGGPDGGKSSPGGKKNVNAPEEKSKSPI